MPTWGGITVLGITNGDCPWGGSLRPVYILPKKERKNKLGLELATAEDVSDVGQMGSLCTSLFSIVPEKSEAAWSKKLR